MTNIIDSHCHFISMEEKGLLLKNELDSFFSKGGSYILEAAIDEQNWEKRLALKKNFPDKILLSAGIHPSAIRNLESQWKTIESQAAQPDCSAIGETGLDFFRDRNPREIQEQGFKKHIELACKLDKPLIVHNRDANDLCRKMINDAPSELKGIMHCFSSDLSTAEEMLAKGFYISFAGNITYKKSESLWEVCRKIPINRLLVETDSPYLSPQAYRGNPNRPGYVVETLQFIAELREEEISALASQIRQNFEKLFGINQN